MLVLGSGANSWLGCLLQTEGFPAQGVHQAERGAQDFHGMCRGRPGLLVLTHQSLLLSLEATYSSFLGEKQEQEAVGGQTWWPPSPLMRDGVTRARDAGGESLLRL